MNEIKDEVMDFDPIFENTKPTFESVEIPKGYGKDDVFAIKPVLGAECLVYLDENGYTEGWYRGVIQDTDTMAIDHGIGNHLNVDLGGGNVMNFSLVYLDHFSIATRD